MKWKQTIANDFMYLTWSPSLALFLIIITTVKVNFQTSTISKCFVLFSATVITLHHFMQVSGEPMWCWCFNKCIFISCYVILLISYIYYYILHQINWIPLQAICHVVWYGKMCALVQVSSVHIQEIKQTTFYWAMLVNSDLRSTSAITFSLWFFIEVRINLYSCLIRYLLNF